MLFIKDILVNCLGSEYHNQRVNITVENGKLLRIGNHNEPEAMDTINGSNHTICAGLTDLHVSFGEPGFEQKETIESGLNAALKGGFTRVCIAPNTNPAIDSRSVAEFVAKRAMHHAVKAEVLGTVTEKRDGKELAELYDMALGGVVGYYDGKRAIQDAGTLKRALLYSKDFNGLVMHYCDDKSISAGGKMNEGITNTMLGLKGLPALAETLMLQRDIALAKYCDSTIHITGVSCAESVAIIRKAKQDGVKITCDVSFYNLLYNDTVLESFDSNYKVQPPIRTEADRQALLNGLQDGTIDAISSDHMPQDIESKKCEFDHAEFGMAAIENCFSALMSNLKGDIDASVIIDKLSNGPRSILGLETLQFAIGEQVEYTIYETADWTQTVANSKSKGWNNPLQGKTFEVKPTQIVTDRGLMKCF